MNEECVVRCVFFLSFLLLFAKKTGKKIGLLLKPKNFSLTFSSLDRKKETKRRVQERALIIIIIIIITSSSLLFEREKERERKKERV
jgi:hypothetical protein